MGELEELIAEIKANRHFDALEMEFLHTRAKGILQLMQLFDSKQEPVKSEVLNKPETMEEEPEITEPVESFQEPVEKEQTVTKESTKKPEKKETPQEETVQNEPVTAPLTKGTPGSTIQEEKKNSEVESQKEKDDEVVLEEENEIADAVSRLGDSFLKGKSLNDLITDQNKLEFKLSNRPVSSIQTAIGINDRFQYIRELFDGDNQKFLEAVKTLDSKQNIKEAVDYLRNNFKWKKNETSLKFVNLVKRRFIHE